MTSEVLLINPRKKRRAKKRRTTKKRTVKRRTVGARKNTTKRRTLLAAPRRKTTTRRVTTMAKRRKTKKRTYKRNPSVRKYARKAGRSARSTFRGLNFKSALTNVIPMQLGMFGAKWLAKRFGGGASETDPASWGARSYIQGGLGAVAIGFAAQMIKPGWGQKVLEGGLNIMFYEMIQNELIAPNEWAAAQFGQNGYYEGDYGYEPGDVEQDETGRSYMLGEDLDWRELPSGEMTGELEPVGPLGELGLLEPVGPLGQLEPVGPLGAADPYARALLDT